MHLVVHFSVLHFSAPGNFDHAFSAPHVSCFHPFHPTFSMKYSLSVNPCNSTPFVVSHGFFKMTLVFSDQRRRAKGSNYTKFKTENFNIAKASNIAYGYSNSGRG